ncbi:cytochrome ubiquinol oxidase subunit I [Aneurinibacillus sp. Ricciae_BoGa-3]|uniref:cytochrome ubiquinol oxidase subunit I n=1 Tax=Aneurinibacillus sp. Ricciae_BoGa-3 TaxID=3022697 RepID=UPI00233FFE54|nr:cytochrome ubiquinol oxidase subunit I [Aneurinibacillus sp. Ricciae_BoGa-3]WCK56493.1 cytochrome ubiquinol oxidase subunit I [Aneurinibacillus sp. Ricciae_BoGa-3]
MDHVLIARSLFGMTMGFHIIFATMGVGLPLMIMFAEIYYLRTGDSDYATMARRWTKGQGVLLGVAIPSGTIAAVQLSLLWPGFMKVVGEVIALPFQIEIFAFFLETLFLSIYVYAADRLSPVMRLVSVFLVTLGATASAVLITDVHTFEATPQGFSVKNGVITNVDPWAAFFNPGFFNSALHVMFSAYMTGAFAISSIAAYKMLKRNVSPKEYNFHQKALLMTILVGSISSLLTALNGHESAKLLNTYNPEKLAAAEGLFRTTNYAPLAIGGVPDPIKGQIHYSIELPGFLSYLATGHFNGTVRGLYDFPREWWPPLYVHTLFDAMVGIGSLLIFLPLVPWALRKIFKKQLQPRWLLWCFVPSGILSMLATEFGWIFSCTGRQPWTIYKLQMTKEAATTSGHVGLLFALFLVMYAILGIATALVLRYYFKRHPLKEELSERETGSVVTSS